MNNYYYEFTPTAIRIRRKGDGAVDPIKAEITPEILAIAAADIITRLPSITEAMVQHIKHTQEQPANA